MATRALWAGMWAGMWAGIWAGIWVSGQASGQAGGRKGGLLSRQLCVVLPPRSCGHPCVGCEVVVLGSRESMDGKTAAEGLSSVYERSSVKWPQATVASVQRLLKASGLKRIDALQRRDQNGCIPVLFAVIYGAKLEVVQFLCEENLGDSLAWEDSFQWDLLMVRKPKGTL